MTFGERLKKIRQSVQKSQKQIQIETGIPQTTLSGWENDISEPTASDIIKLATVFNITVTQLLEGDEETDQAATTERQAG